MAIYTEFIDFIVPINEIRAKYPGGWEACLRDHEPLLGGRVWHDDYLFRDGAMNQADISFLIQTWKSYGFTGKIQVNGQSEWGDFCVHQGLFGRPTLPCP